MAQASTSQRTRRRPALSPLAPVTPVSASLLSPSARLVPRRRSTAVLRRVLVIIVILALLLYGSIRSEIVPVPRKVEDTLVSYLRNHGYDLQHEEFFDDDTPLDRTAGQPAGQRQRPPVSPPPEPIAPPLVKADVDLTREDGRVIIPIATEGVQRPHPIPLLMQRARKQWHEIRSRQSRTFRQAVATYRKQNDGRNPPKNFDRWYAFARAHRVQIIDDYKYIDDAIRPFLAISPENFRKRVAYVSDWFITEQGWGMEIKEGKMRTFGGFKDTSRPREFNELIKPFVKDLPDLKSWHTAADGPHIWLGGDERIRLEELIKQEEFDPREDEHPDFHSKAAAPPIGPMPQTCPPGTPMRADGFVYGVAQNNTLMPPPPEGASVAFVKDVRAALDICRNPQLRHTHSAVSWTFPLPGPHLPVFSPGVHGHFADLPTIIVEQFNPNEHDNTPWEARKDARLLWRGQTSGPNWLRRWPWKSSHRARLHLLAQDGIGTPEIIHLDARNGSGVYDRETTTPSIVNTAFLDVGMVGPAVQCDQEDGTCDEMTRVFHGYKSKVTIQQSKNYKFELDIDGNSWSGRFRRLMLSSAVVFKATIFPQFWTDWAVPWLHYVPISIDYSDMWDALAYFRGGLYGEDAHDDEARSIAVAGQDFARDYLRWEDMQAYQFRLMLEYARLYSMDRRPGGFGADYEGDGDDEPTW